MFKVNNVYVILQFLISTCLAVEWRIFLDDKNPEQTIVSPSFPENSMGYTFVRWYIDSMPRNRIELTCDKVFLAQTHNCYYGMFGIRDGSRTMKTFCEETNNLKLKSVKNRMMVEFWLEHCGIGQFKCKVSAMPVPKSYLEVPSEEIDSKEHGTYLGPRSTTCPCGWSNKERIVGGKETRINEYPLMVSLVNRRSNDRICGGTIITPYHILTAAHCFIGRTWTPLSIIVGEHDFNKAYETNATAKIDVKHVVQHKDFKSKSLEHDIAIAVLYNRIHFNKFVGPACLPVEKMHRVNEYVKALGWGQISSVKKINSNVLKSVNLRIVDTKTCAGKYSSLKADSKSQFCTYARKKDTCQGDSGGPLLWLDPDTNRYTQLGLVSYGKTCASEVPAVNTDIYYYMDWIQETVQKHKSHVHVCVKDIYFNRNYRNRVKSLRLWLG